MSWGEPQQPPYDPNNPYGQQQPYQQPGGQPQPDQGQSQPTGWGAPSQSQAYGAVSGAGYPQPTPDPNNPYGQPQQNPFGVPPVPSPYGQQPTQAYGQPGYGQPPYGQPVYGQPEFPQYPGTAPKKTNGKFVAILVGALVVVGGGIGTVIALTGNHSSTNPVAGPTPSTGTSGTHSSSGSLATPSSVQGLTELQNSVAKQAVSTVKSGLTSDAALYPDPVIAAYNDGGGNNVTTVMVAQSMAALSSTNQADLNAAGSASDVVADIMTGAGVSNAQPETTAASSGALSCGTKNNSGATETICVWYDQTTFGIVEYFDGTSAGSAAPVADALRAAAEG
jgi:hypothetical protein